MKNTQKIRFSSDKNAEFFATLRERVQAHFDKNKVAKQGNSSLYVKTAILYTLYIGSFLLILLSGWPGWALLLLCVTMGLGACGLGVNVMHDALHNSYAKSKFWNGLVSATMEMLGGSNATWKIQHNLLHHTYTNVYGMDEDVDDKPFIRMSPDGKLKKYHQYQHLYAPVLYGFSNASWLTQKDFVQYLRFWKNGTLNQVGIKPLPGFLSLIVTKSLYFGTVIGLPILLLPFAWYWTIIGFLLVQFVSGLLMTLIFLTAHAVGETDHFQPDANGQLENNWAIHQVLTTANFATPNPLWNWYVGGLNHQIEHHLFPQISHVHYPQLAPIVRKTANEFGLEYKEYSSFASAIVAHFQYLKDIGRQPVPVVAA